MDSCEKYSSETYYAKKQINSVHLGGIIHQSNIFRTSVIPLMHSTGYNVQLNRNSVNNFFTILYPKCPRQVLKFSHIVKTRKYTCIWSLCQWHSPHNSWFQYSQIRNYVDKLCHLSFVEYGIWFIHDALSMKTWKRSISALCRLDEGD